MCRCLQCALQSTLCRGHTTRSCLIRSTLDFVSYALLCLHISASFLQGWLNKLALIQSNCNKLSHCALRFLVTPTLSAVFSCRPSSRHACCLACVFLFASDLTLSNHCLPSIGLFLYQSSTSLCHLYLFFPPQPTLYRFFFLTHWPFVLSPILVDTYGLIYSTSVSHCSLQVFACFIFQRPNSPSSARLRLRSPYNNPL